MRALVLFQIVQSQRNIAFAYEYATSNRGVNMGEFVEGPVDTWMGTSNGHWEGDTLVVDTIGFNDKFWFDFAGHPHTEKLHVIERYHRRDLGNLDVDITIFDPDAYTDPWKIKRTSALMN